MADLARFHEEEKPTGTPIWFVTFADMMGLLLCFFIMLVAMSEVKAEKFRHALESIRSAFGTPQAAGAVAPGTRPGTNSFEEYFRRAVSSRGNPDNMGGAETVSLQGNEYLCRTVSEGMMITFGLKAPFERGSAELSPQLKGELNDLAFQVSGYTNLIIVRGHCSSDEIDLKGVDRWELGFARTRAVADYLMQKDISERRLVMVSLANTEPLSSNLSPHGRAGNRRIEVILAHRTVGPEP